MLVLRLNLKLSFKIGLVSLLILFYFQGIDLGQCLIKRAVQSLQAEIPNLTQFSTLSPVPGFRSWLLHQLREAERGRETMLKNCDWHDVGQIVHATDDAPPYGQVRQLLANHAWVKDESKVRLLEPLLMKLCAHYLFVEKRRAYALDSVGTLHCKLLCMVFNNYFGFNDLII